MAGVVFEGDREHACQGQAVRSVSFPSVRVVDILGSCRLTWTLDCLVMQTGRSIRFTDPKLLPKPILAPVTYPQLLWKHSVNVNDQILKFYVDSIVPDITKTLGEVRRPSPTPSSQRGAIG